jgi:hypothetical protein
VYQVVESLDAEHEDQVQMTVVDLVLVLDPAPVVVVDP